MIKTPRRTPALSAVLIILLTTFAGAASLTLALPEAQAQARTLQEVSLKLVVANPEPPATAGTSQNAQTTEAADSQEARARALRHAEITRITARSIEKRLTAAGVKQFTVQPQRHGTIHITAHTSIERDALTALVTAPGNLEIRPILQSGDDWTSIASALPRGIELHQDAEHFDPQYAYLWSAQHSTLSAFLRQLAVPSTLFTVYPTDGGWRSLSLGEPVSTQQNLARTTSKATPAGIPFITLEFHNAFPRERGRDLAFVLDGEVITIIRSANERATARMELPTPAHLQSRDAQIAWAAQIAGRLAAHLPLTVAEIKD